MTRGKTRDYIKVVLNAHKLENITRESALNHINDAYKKAKIFNWFSFEMGFGLGMFLMLILKHFNLI